MPERIGLTYNTDRSPIRFREYGRIIQEAVQLLQQIPDRAARTQAAHRVVRMMAALTPGFKATTENWHKLWDHLYLIAGNDLDIDAPFPPPPPPEDFPPQKISYPTYEVKYRFFGKNVESLVTKATQLPHAEMRIDLLNIIANFMRMAYRQWNKDDISKEKICRYISELSNGFFTEGWLCQAIKLSNGTDRNRHRSRSRRHRR